jgi:hypothetical protein
MNVEFVLKLLSTTMITKLWAEFVVKNGMFAAAKTLDAEEGNHCTCWDAIKPL